MTGGLGSACCLAAAQLSLGKPGACAALGCLCFQLCHFPAWNRRQGGAQGDVGCRSSPGVCARTRARGRALPKGVDGFSSSSLVLS